MMKEPPGSAGGPIHQLPCLQCESPGGAAAGSLGLAVIP